MMVAPGASIHSARPLGWLLERGCRVLFVDDVRPQPSTSRPFEHAASPLGRRWRRWFGWRLGHRIMLAEYRWLRRRISADVVHVHWVDPRAQLCAEAGLKPLVLSVWGSDVNLMLREDADPWSRQAAAEALAAADLVLVDAPDMPAKCAQLAGCDVPTAFLPLGIDTHRFRDLPQELGQHWRARLDISTQATVFMSVRAWGARYGHQFILEAFAEATRRSDRPMVLVFKVYNTRDYSEAAVLEQTLRARVDELGLSGQVRWISEVALEELPALYRLADVIVNWPEVDAFPVTFIEAAAAMCPLITIDLPAYRDTFASEFFRFVPAGDLDGLAEAMREHAEGDRVPQRAKLAPARDLMVREYDERVTAQRLLEHYERLLECTH